MSLVFLHGFTGSPRSWQGFAARFRARAAVRAPALIGHGAGAGEPEQVVSFEDEVDRLAARLRSERIRGAHLVGYSLGARVGLGLLLRHSELFQRATLIGVHAGLDGADERRERIAADERWCELIEQRGLEAFVDTWQSQPLFATQLGLPGEVLAEQRRERLGHDPRGLIRALRSVGLGRMPCYAARLGEIEVPVTLVVGEDDTKFREQSKAMLEVWPAARLAVVPGCGHNVPLERPDALEQLLEIPSGGRLAPPTNQASGIRQGRHA